jgi:hypothetical protein
MDESSAAAAAAAVEPIPEDDGFDNDLGPPSLKVLMNI